MMHILQICSKRKFIKKLENVTSKAIAFINILNIGLWISIVVALLIVKTTCSLDGFDHGSRLRRLHEMLGTYRW